MRGVAASCIEELTFLSSLSSSFEFESGLALTSDLEVFRVVVLPRLVTREAVSCSVGVLLLNKDAFVDEVRSRIFRDEDGATVFEIFDPLGVLLLEVGGKGD